MHTDADDIAERLDVANQRATAEPAPWLPPKPEIEDSLPLAVKVEKILKYLLDFDRGMREGPSIYKSQDEDGASFTALVEALHKDADFTIRCGRGLVLKRLGNSIVIEALPQEERQNLSGRIDFCGHITIGNVSYPVKYCGGDTIVYPVKY